MNTTTFKEEIIVKAPHYFYVHYRERFTSVNGGFSGFGKAYPVEQDNVWVNVYGFRSEEEWKQFDSILLRGLLIGSENKKYLCAANSEEEVMKEIEADESFVRGICTLAAPFGRTSFIENLPECIKMHFDKENKDLLCGKPINEFGDGSMGGCVLASYDQEEEPFEGFKCPMKIYWRNK